MKHVVTWITFALFFLLLLTFSQGCATMDRFKSKSDEHSMSFQSGLIVYSFERDARDYMERAVRLFRQNVPEHVGRDEINSRIHSLYSRADVNRDHHITLDEARSFYRQLVLEFEQKLPWDIWSFKG